MTVDVEARLRTAFRAVEVADPVGPPPDLGRAPQPHRAAGLLTRRRILAGAGVAVAGTAVAAVVGTRGGTPPAAAAGQAALRRAAQRAAALPALAPRPDQFLYSRTVSQWYQVPTTGFLLADPTIDYAATSFLVASVSESWQPANLARGGWAQSALPVLVHPDEEARARATGVLKILKWWYAQGHNGPVPPGPWGEDSFTDPSRQYLASLPTDPSVLYDRVEAFSRGHGPSLDAEMFVTVGDALRSALAPPAVTAAFYEVTARIPGVQLVSSVVDLNGRQGTAVASSDGRTRSEMIFDDTTGIFLGTRTVQTQAAWGYPAGTVTGSDATTVTVVDAIGDR